MPLGDGFPGKFGMSLCLPRILARRSRSHHRCAQGIFRNVRIVTDGHVVVVAVRARPLRASLGTSPWGEGEIGNKCSPWHSRGGLRQKCRHSGSNAVKAGSWRIPEDPIGVGIGASAPHRVAIRYQTPNPHTQGRLWTNGPSNELSGKVEEAIVDPLAEGQRRRPGLPARRPRHPQELQLAFPVRPTGGTATTRTTWSPSSVPADAAARERQQDVGDDRDHHPAGPCAPVHHGAPRLGAAAAFSCALPMGTSACHRIPRAPGTARFVCSHP